MTGVPTRQTMRNDRTGGGTRRVERGAQRNDGTGERGERAPGWQRTQVERVEQPVGLPMVVFSLRPLLHGLSTGRSLPLSLCAEGPRPAPPPK